MLYLYSKAYIFWVIIDRDSGDTEPYYVDPHFFKRQMRNVFECLDNIAANYKKWKYLSQLSEDRLDVVLKDQINYEYGEYRPMFIDISQKMCLRYEKEFPIPANIL